MSEPSAIVIAALVPTATQIVAAIIHYMAERRTREIAEKAVAKVEEVKVVAQNTGDKVEEVKTIVQNGGNHQ